MMGMWVIIASWLDVFDVPEEADLGEDLEDLADLEEHFLVRHGTVLVQEPASETVILAILTGVCRHV